MQSEGSSAQLPEQTDEGCSLDARSAAPSPIQQLSDEVLGEIFFECLSTEGYIKPSSTDAPILLTLVSSHWRQIALSTPQLWSSIFIGRPPRPPIAFIQRWLERSGSCLLALGFKCGGVAFTIEVMTAFQPYLYRCRKLEVWFPHGHDFQLLSHLPPSPAPQLRHLALHVSESSGSPAWSWLCSFLAVAPPIHIPTSGNTMSSTWSHISDVEISSRLSADMFLDLLEQAPGLEGCNVLDIVPPGASADSRSIVLKKLRYIRLHAAVDVAPIIQALTAPSLTSLMVFNDRVEQSVEVLFSSLMLRSSCALENLTLINLNISPQELAAILHATSASLSNLNLMQDGAAVTDEVLGHLTYRPSGHRNTLCPKLETLKLSGACISSTDGVLSEMIRSRSRPSDPSGPFNPNGGPPLLKDVSLMLRTTSGHVKDASILDQVKADGMKLEYAASLLWSAN